MDLPDQAIRRKPDDDDGQIALTTVSETAVSSHSPRMPNKSRSPTTRHADVNLVPVLGDDDAGDGDRDEGSQRPLPRPE
jgi:hypothetical protein